MENQTIAKLIVEKSGGSLNVEIWENDQLVWSHDYSQLSNDKAYKNVIDDMLKCKNWQDFDGCDYDLEGNVASQDVGEFCVPILSYQEGTWSEENSTYLSDQLIVANADRLPSEIVVPAKARMEDYE